MYILKRTFNRITNHIGSWRNISWLDSSWLGFSWLENAGYVPCMDIAMPPVEIGFIYLEMSNEIESFYSRSSHENY